MAEKKTNSESPLDPAADQKRNEVLRTEGRRPGTPVVGFGFGESICLTPNCGAVVKYEISDMAPWRMNSDHVTCDRCAATYKVTLESADSAAPQVAFRNATDRQS